MDTPSLFVGIDVSKDFLDLATWPQQEVWRVPNAPEALPDLVARLCALAPSLLVLEASGGYELDAAAALAAAGLPVALVNPRQVRDYAKALGQLAKTDRLDAVVLARFAQATRPEVRPLPDEESRAFGALVVRRRQLVEMLRVEQNRRASCRDQAVRRDLDATIHWLRKRLKEIEGELRRKIKASPVWRAKEELLRSVPGVGPTTAAVLLAELSELGKADNKAIAALGGVAPRARESGRYKGPRRIQGGRGGVRAALYMATLVGVKYNEVLKKYYERLQERGKRKKVALVACMRKLLVILNAMLKHNTPWDPAYAVR